MFSPRLAAYAHATSHYFDAPAPLAPTAGVPAHTRAALTLLTDCPRPRVEPSPASATTDELPTPVSEAEDMPATYVDRAVLNEDGCPNKENALPARRSVFSPLCSEDNGDSDKENVPPPRAFAEHFADDDRSDKENVPPPRTAVFDPATCAAAKRSAPVRQAFYHGSQQTGTPVLVPRRPHSAPAVLQIICPRPKRTDPAARAAFLPPPSGPLQPVRLDFREPPVLLSYVPGAAHVCRVRRCHCRETLDPDYADRVLFAAGLAIRVANGEAADVVQARLRQAARDDEVPHAAHILAQTWVMLGPLTRPELMREVNKQIAATVHAYQRDMTNSGIEEEELELIAERERRVRELAAELADLGILA